jgi:hypothetical protein
MISSLIGEAVVAPDLFVVVFRLEFPSLPWFSDKQDASPPFPLLRPHVRDKRQQFFQGGKVRGLSGHHMLDPARDASLRHLAIHPQVHVKRPMNG